MIRHIATVAAASLTLCGCVDRDKALTTVVSDAVESRSVAKSAKASSVLLNQQVFDSMVAATDRHVAMALARDRSVGLDVESVTPHGGSDVSIRGRITGVGGVVFLERTGGLMSGLVEIPGQGRTILMQQASGRIQVTRFEGASALQCAFESQVDIGAVNCTAGGLSEVRVLVLYDDLVAAGDGEQTLLRFIQLMADRANKILADSQVDVVFRIADTKRFNIVEQAALVDDLKLLTGPSGANAQDVLKEKRAANADIVVFIVSKSTGDDGISHQLMAPFDHFGPFATAVMTFGSFLWSDVFTHELGHTMGAGHQDGPGAFTWSRAKVRTSPELGTVMASGVQAMNTIPYFSNPNVFVPGSATEKTGDNLHDNAKTLNATRGCVEQFRTQ